MLDGVRIRRADVATGPLHAVDVEDVERLHVDIDKLDVSHPGLGSRGAVPPDVEVRVDREVAKLDVRRGAVDVDGPECSRLTRGLLEHDSLRAVRERAVLLDGLGRVRATAHLDHGAALSDW